MVKRVRLGAAWQSWIPDVLDWEQAFAPTLVTIRPDIIHVHDPKVLGLATVAAHQLRQSGTPARIVYDARENFAGLPPGEWGSARYHQSIVNLEARYIRHADGVMTVSDPIADVLESRYRLARRPSVVLNLPVYSEGADTPAEPSASTVRTDAGLAASTPLLVYSGGISHARGIDVLVSALPRLPNVHLAIIAVPFPHPMTEGLLELASSLMVRDRVHVLPPVEQRHLISYLSTATVGVHPMPAGSANHDMALPNKLFEYLHAGLPLVVSDARQISDFVLQNGVGETFRTGDPASFADAVSAVLSSPNSYRLGPARRELIRSYSWQAQEPVISALYDTLANVPSPEVTSHFPELEIVWTDAVQPR
jgi:glycosyltransferase involved in cell wall biosynthesis